MSNRIVVLIAVLVCIGSAATGWGSARYYAHGLKQQADRTESNSAKLARQQAELAKQEGLTCKANAVLNGLLVGAVDRQLRALKVDPPAKRKIDKAAVEQLMGLIAVYAPAVKFCEARTAIAPAPPLVSEHGLWTDGR